jgi:hypothetical protein
MKNHLNHTTYTITTRNQHAIYLAAEKATNSKKRMSGKSRRQLYENNLWKDQADIKTILQIFSTQSFRASPT